MCLGSFYSYTDLMLSRLHEPGCDTFIVSVNNDYWAGYHSVPGEGEGYFLVMASKNVPLDGPVTFSRLD